MLVSWSEVTSRVKEERTVLLLHPFPFEYFMHLTALYTKAFVRRLCHIEVKSPAADSPNVREKTRGAKCMQAVDTSPDERTYKKGWNEIQTCVTENEAYLFRSLAPFKTSKRVPLPV